jgi:WD40 repeat protein
MIKKLFFLLALAAALWQPAAAGELTFGWNLVNESGAIYDMEFMPDNNFFVFADYKSLQVRSTETGELVNSYPLQEKYADHSIEFTPDSTRMILAYGDKIELRNVSDMSIINQHIIPTGTDTEGYDIFQSNISFYEMVVDPVRPYVYVIRNRSGTLSGGKYFLIRRIVIYNYETMEEVDVLSTEEDYTIFEKMAISKDGKYLAVNSALSSHLRVWDLDTRQKIRDYKICDLYSGANGDGQPSCTKFSELNTDIIYFSGVFPQYKDDPGDFSGIFIYSISQNKIIDSTFAIKPNYAGTGYFILCDNEERIIKSDGKNILILNLKKSITEQKISRDTISTGKPYWSIKLLYSYINNTLIGFNKEKYSHAIYNNRTNTEDPIHFDSIIYPNPSTGLVTLTNSCQNPVQSYEILDVNGLILIPNMAITNQQGSVSIDISSITSGVYFLRFHCGSSVFTYKVIKEN